MIRPSALIDPGLMRVVVADDSPIILGATRDLFEAAGAEVHTIESAIGLSGLLRRVQPDIVILDMNMPAIRGDEAVATVRRICPRATVVLFSDDKQAAAHAKAHGIAWVSKAAPEMLVVTAMREATRGPRR